MKFVDTVMLMWPVSLNLKGAPGDLQIFTEQMVRHLSVLLRHHLSRTPPWNLILFS